MVARAPVSVRCESLPGRDDSFFGRIGFFLALLGDHGDAAWAAAWAAARSRWSWARPSSQSAFSFR